MQFSVGFISVQSQLKEIMAASGARASLCLLEELSWLVYEKNKLLLGGIRC